MKHSWLTIGLVVLLPLAFISYVYIGRMATFGMLSLYGALSVGRILFQIATAHYARKITYPTKMIPASIIVTVYNEEVAIFEKSLQSFKNQQEANCEIIVVDDGSDNAAHINRICDDYSVKYIYQDHAGKREALYKGFNASQGIYILTADSDTIWDKYAARDMIACLASDTTIGATTGYVGILNKEDNFLTLLVAMRYWMAFKQERASQSLFGCVTCVSGPLGGYRADLIHRIKDSFVTQTFMGKRCTFGDDRHLTNLILGLGYKVIFSQAECYTMSPTNLLQYVKQQTRWGKSHWRETLWQLKALPYQHLYLAVDLGLTLLLPFLLVGSIGYYVYLSTQNINHIYTLFTTIILMSTIRVIEPIRITKDWRFLMFAGYAFFHLFVLLPVKFYALATVNVTGWGTRGVQTSMLARISYALRSFL